MATDREAMLLYRNSHAFCGNQSLRVISVEQESRELLTAEARSYVASSQRFSYYSSGLLKRRAADQMAISVVNLFEVVQIHHQDAERARLSLGPRSLSTSSEKNDLLVSNPVSSSCAISRWICC